MRQMFKQVPSQKTISRWVYRTCDKHLVVRPNRIVFAQSPNAYTNDDHLVLPDPAYLALIEGPYYLDTRPMRLWLTYFHEVAHWLVQAWSGVEADHRPDMYAILLGLWLSEGLPLDHFWKSEEGYRPGSLVRGMRQAGELLMEHTPRRVQVDREARKRQALHLLPVVKVA